MEKDILRQTAELPPERQSSIQAHLGSVAIDADVFIYDGRTYGVGSMSECTAAANAKADLADFNALVEGLAPNEL